MVEKISVQIALEGGAEIERQLEGIGKAGEKAFEQITKAADKAGGFRELRPEQVTAALQKMGVTGTEAVNKIQTAVKTAVRLEKVAAGVRVLETGFSKLGATGAVVLTRLDAAFGKFGATMTRALGPLAGVARALGPIGIAAAGVTAGSVALVKFANAAEETLKSLQQLQAVTGQSISNLSALANVFQQGGTEVKTFATEMGKLQEKIDAAGQTAKTRDASQETIEWANNLSRVRQQFDNMASGARVSFDALTTLDTKVKALLESLAQARTPQEQLNKLADIFRNLSQQSAEGIRVMQQLGAALGLSPETIATLSRGSAELARMAEQARALGITLSELDQQNLQGMIRAQNEAGTLFDSLKQKMGALVAPAITSFWEGFTNRIRELVPQFVQIAESIGQLDFTKIGAAAADFLLVLSKIAAGWATMLSGQVSFKDAAIKLFQELGSTLAGIALDIGKAVGQGIIEGIISAIKGAAGSVLAAIRSLFPGGAGGGPVGGDVGLPMASGGVIAGRGTGTSDSNLAWVSRGEHIMPARAVRQPGVLAFLEALRRSGGNLSRVLDGMGRFALGGMVPRHALAFADGGLVGSASSRRVLNLHIEGRTFSGLTVPESTAQSLERFAVFSQISSTGRKPSWKR